MTWCINRFKFRKKPGLFKNKLTLGKREKNEYCKQNNFTENTLDTHIYNFFNDK